MSSEGAGARLKPQSALTRKHLRRDQAALRKAGRASLLPGDSIKERQVSEQMRAVLQSPFSPVRIKKI